MESVWPFFKLFTESAGIRHELVAATRRNPSTVSQLAKYLYTGLLPDKIGALHVRLFYANNSVAIVLNLYKMYGLTISESKITTIDLIC